MRQKLTSRMNLWTAEAVALYDEILYRIAPDQSTAIAGTDGVTRPSSVVTSGHMQAAATMAAAIFNRAALSGPYDVLEDDPEAEALEEERLRREETTRRLQQDRGTLPADGSFAEHDPRRTASA
jgi:hypothetical protein